MSAFADGLEDGWARDSLLAALADGGPVRAFEDALGYFPAERQRWLACRQGRMGAVVRAWLEASTTWNRRASLPRASEPGRSPRARLDRREG